MDSQVGSVQKVNIVDSQGAEADVGVVLFLLARSTRITSAKPSGLG